jgi:hypothetical protein
LLAPSAHRSISGNGEDLGMRDLGMGNGEDLEEMEETNVYDSEALTSLNAYP